MKSAGIVDQESKKAFTNRLIILSLPIMLQNLLSSALSFTDTLMIGRIGESALAAVGLANQMFFLISVFFFGVSSGAAIFLSQYWGAHDLKSMHHVMGLACLLGVGGAVVSSLLSLVFPQAIMHIFTDDPSVVARGREYLLFAGGSYIFTAVVSVFSTALRSTGDAKTPMFMTLFSMVLNIILNYLLIYGKFGFPRMEVVGAALATSISRLLEMVLLLVYIYGKKHPVSASLSQMFTFGKKLASRYFLTCIPVILNEMFWSLGMTTYKIAYSRMGIEVIASVNVSEAIQDLFFVALMGIANASAIIIGNRIGQNLLDTAHKNARQIMGISLVVGSVLGFLLILASSVVVIPFGLSVRVGRMTTLSLISLGFLLPIKALNMVTITGILRSGGDTRFSMLTELSGVWLIGVPCAFFGGLVLHLPIYFLFLFVAFDEVFKLTLSLARVRSGKWMNRLADGDA